MSTALAVPVGEALFAAGPNTLPIVLPYGSRYKTLYLEETPSSLSWIKAKLAQQEFRDFFQKRCFIAGSPSVLRRFA